MKVSISSNHTLRTLLSLSTTASLLLVTACGNNMNDNMNGGMTSEDPPEIPPSSTMVMDFDDFLDSARQAQGTLPFSNWARGAGVVGVWSVIITVTLAIPVAAFGEAFNHEPQRGDDAWRWSYDVPVNGITYTATLEARGNGGAIDWTMLLSADNGFENFEWFTGSSNLTNTAGSWTLNSSPEDPSPFLQIDWTRDASGVPAEITYTNIIPDVPNNGGFITYSIADSEPYDASYTLFTPEDDNTINIEWNRTSKAGRITDPLHFGDPDWHCWNTEVINVDCDGASTDASGGASGQ